MDSIYKRLFISKLGLILLGFLLLLILFNWKGKDFGISSEWILLISAISTSVIASFLVGAFFQFNIKDEISKDHLGIMEIKEELYNSGILKYYGSFMDCISELKSEVRKAKSITIYVNFGNTILNTISEDLINSFKQKKDIKIILLHPDNKFISGLGALWGKSNSDYNEQGIKKKIQTSINLLTSSINELKLGNLLKAEVRIYQMKYNPVFYSFYILDDLIYYTPSKNMGSKSFPPLTILAQKTSNQSSIYNKCLYELNDIIGTSRNYSLTKFN